MPAHVHMRDDRPLQSVFVRHMELAHPATGPHVAAHGHAVLTFFVGGSAELEQRGRVHVHAGDVHLIPAGEAHRLVSARKAEAWGVGFDTIGLAGPELAGLLAPFERVRDGATSVISIPAARQEHLRTLLAELGRETATPALEAQPVQRSLLTLALAEVARAARQETPTTAPPLVAEALRMIERHCLGPLSLRDVAAALGRTPAHLTTAMRLATGRTAQQWIVAMRMAEARRRLLTSDEPVAAIAGRLGDLDPTHFIRLFRRTHGRSPAAWRALQRAA